MEDKNKIIQEHEIETNERIIRIFKLFMIFYPTLFMSRIPVLEIMIAIVAGLVISLLPGIIYKKDILKDKFKWIVIILMIINVTMLYSLLYANVMMLWILPSLIAAMYYDKKLVKCAIIFTIPALAVAEMFASNGSLEFIAGFSWIPLHMFCYISQIVCLSIVSTSIINNANKKLMDSYDSKNEVTGMLDKNIRASKVLDGVIENLSSNMNDTYQKLDDIEKSVNEISNGSEDILKFVQDTNNNVELLVNEINSVKNEAKDIEEIKENMNNITCENKNNMKKINDAINGVKESIGDNKDNIFELLNKIKLISSELSNMSNVANSIDLLALNASIEAARAGEAGRGFSVVADQIKNLALESAGYAKNIDELLKEIKSQSENTVKSINQNDSAVNEGFSYLENTNKSFDFLLEIEDMMEEKLNNIFKSMDRFYDNGQKISSNMATLVDKNKHNNNDINLIQNSIKDIIEYTNESKNIMIEIKSQSQILMEGSKIDV